MVKNILVCIDRDGTINYDDKYYLGHKKNWKDKIKFLPNVIKGLKKLNKELPNTKIYFITNQPGIAIKEFKLLNLKKANEVCEFIIKKLTKQKIKIDGYKVCKYASPYYVKKRKEYQFNKKMVGDYSCIKPKPGMINQILKDLKFKTQNTKIYVLGDRITDVKTGINAGGKGILIPFSNRPEESEKVKEIKSKRKYIAKNFLDAINYIIKE